MNILAIQRLTKSQSLKPRTWKQTKLKWSGCTEGWTFVRNKLDTHYTLVEVKTKATGNQNLSWKEEQPTGQGTSFTSGLQVVVTLLHKPSAVPSAGLEAAPCSLREELLVPLFHQSPGWAGAWSLHRGDTEHTLCPQNNLGKAFPWCCSAQLGWTSCSSSLKRYRAMHWGKSPLGKKKYLESKLEDAYHE